MSKKKQLLEINNKYHDAVDSLIINYPNNNNFTSEVISKISENIIARKFLLGNDSSVYQAKIDELTPRECIDRKMVEYYGDHEFLKMTECSVSLRIIGEQVIDEMYAY